MLDAATILAIPENHPHLLFPDRTTVEETFRTLARKWHPDLNSDPQSKVVFQHVNSLFSAAKKALAQNTWGYGDVLTITGSKGEKHYPFLRQQPFELGELYVCERKLIFATRREHDELCKRFLASTKAFAFPSDQMKTEFHDNLPRNTHTIANGDRAYTIIDKAPELIRLADIIAKKGPMDPKHVAWSLSRMYNMCCWLEFSGLRHLDISPETFYINPETHGGALLGGWYFSKGPKDEKALAAPARTAHYATMDANKAHLSMVKQTGRRLFGAVSSATLNANPGVPDYLKRWLTSPAGDNPVREYEMWHKTLEQCFGKRRFTPYPLTPQDIYGA